MLRYKLPQSLHPVKNHINELLIYSGVEDLYIEVADTQSVFGENVLFIKVHPNETNVEDVMVEIARFIYNKEKHTKFTNKTEILFLDRFESVATKLAAVFDTAIDSFSISRFGCYHV
jgi:hypothetical protein